MFWTKEKDMTSISSSNNFEYMNDDVIIPTTIVNRRENVDAYINYSFFEALTDEDDEF